MGLLEINSFDTATSDIDHQGAGFTGEIFRKKVKADISDIITDTDPNRAMFLRFLEKAGNKEESSYKFEFLEESIKERKTTLKTGSGMIASGASTDLQTVDSDLFQVGDLLMVLALDDQAEEIVKVTARTSATVYVVARAQSGTGAETAFAVADEIVKIGSIFAENTTSADPSSIEPLWRYNYTQTFKSSVAISGRFNGMNNFIRGGSNELQHQLDFKMKSHIEDIETAFLFGRRNFVAGAGSETSTGGLKWWLETYGNLAGGNGNLIDASASTFNEAYLDNQSNQLFRYGASNKLAICSGKTLAKISTFAKDYLRKNTEASKKLGVAVTDYVSAHGTLSLVHSRTLEHTTEWEKDMFIVDPQFVKKRYVEGRDTHINTNVQANDLDGVKHEILSDVGLELRNPDAHYLIHGIDNTIS